MISPETVEELAEVKRKLTMLTITFYAMYGIMIAEVIFYFVVGIILYIKSKQKEGRAKIILRVLAIIFWIPSVILLGRLIGAHLR